MTSSIASFRSLLGRTRAGLDFSYRTYGSPDNPAVLYLHDVYGLFESEPLLEALGATHYVLAPSWPGYDEHATESSVKDMLDFTLHGWDLASALGLTGDDGRSPIRLTGHGFGAMIAAEMAATAPSLVASLTLLAPLGLWDDAAPIPDLFASLPFEVPGLWFADPSAGSSTMFGGLDPGDRAALQRFVIANSRRLGTAGKILFPIADRGVARRLHRITCPTTLVWGDRDRLVPRNPYADLWSHAIADSAVLIWPDAGHALGHDGDVVELATLLAIALGKQAVLPASLRLS